METRRLGRTDLLVPVVGLGGSPLGREDCAEQDALETVWASLEGGMTLVDTSPLYGHRKSEERIGKALRERPDLAARCVLSTKTGRYGGDHRDYSYEGTLQSVARSMELLGVGYLPIVHIHDIWSADHLAEVLRSKAAHAALRRLQSDGTVGHIGIGTRDLGTLELAVESGEFDVLMVPNQYNLVEQAGGDLIRSALQRDVGVIIAGTYASGILAKGSADPNARYWYRPPSQEVRDHVAGVEALCRKWGCSLAAAAVQFCLRGPAAGAVTILGARSRRQVKENVAACSERIPMGFWHDVEAWLAAGPIDDAEAT